MLGSEAGERFEGWDESPYNFVPQGGGDHYIHHRCPGEWIAIALLKGAVKFLSREIEYEVPDQDLELQWSQMPPLPRSRFVIRNVRVMDVS
jgi:fatty-acid peroxygenase